MKYNGKNILLDQGRFVVGCNYWASHAGTAMWSDWRAEVVEKDFKALTETGLQVLRVFPLWSDFQPIQALAGHAGDIQEYRFGEQPLPDDEAGRAGVSAQMIERFAELIRLAEKYHIQLIVSLLAGWMSGRLFVPPALARRNVLTDSVALMWQIRFIRYFVKRFKGAQNILAWEPGNECNCMAQTDRAQAWVWTSAITDAIRAADTDRPVFSGMHGMGVGFATSWTIQDQAELTDLLTTHPYPVFTPYCDRDPVNTIRPSLHAAAESRMYADIGGKPCLVEEIGTLGPMIASESVAADFVRTGLFSAWAHDCHGFFWWCGFDQAHLAHAPYDWCSAERELGLLRINGEVKPVGREIKKFREFIETLPFETLPPRLTDAVCLLTDDQDAWAAAYGSFILAKQAGVEIEFQYADQPLVKKPAGLYFLPSLAGLMSIKRRRMEDLLQRVREGAVLYVSVDNALLSPFEAFTGLEVQTRQHRSGPTVATLDAVEGKPVLPVLGNIKLAMTPTRARVLGREADGNPVFTSAEYGKGKVYFLSFPMETELVKLADSFYGPSAKPYWSIYQAIGRSIPSRQAVGNNHPQVGVTEHPLAETKRVVVMINYSPEPVDFALTLAPEWQLDSTLYGQPGSNNQFKLNANDAAVVIIKT